MDRTTSTRTFFWCVRLSTFFYYNIAITISYDILRDSLIWNRRKENPHRIEQIYSKEKVGHISLSKSRWHSLSFSFLFFFLLGYFIQTLRFCWGGLRVPLGPSWGVHPSLSIDNVVLWTTEKVEMSWVDKLSNSTHSLWFDAHYFQVANWWAWN